MGFFGTFAYSKGRWVGEKPSGSPSLVVAIHDSDIATFDYTPSGAASGRFYLGTEPRIYFDDEAASSPVDRAVEAKAFADWVLQVTGHDLRPERVEELMASPDADAEPIDVFVEETVQKLLALAVLPLPSGLSGEQQDVQAQVEPAKRRGWFRRG